MDYFIDHEDFHYTRILLFSWDCYLQPVVLSETNGKFFSERASKKFEGSSSKFLVINCNNVLDVEDHFSDEFDKLLISNPNSTLLFYSDDGMNKLVRYIGEHTSKINHKFSFMHDENGTSCYIISNKEVCSSEIKNKLSEAKRIENKKVVKIVADSFRATEDEVLSSTPLSANGQFNATTVISSPSKFRWIVLLMVEKIFTLSKEKSLKGYSLVAGSLRGAAIAGSVWELLQQFDQEITIQIIDHVGPYHDVVGKKYESVDLMRNDCIYIGDFLIAGTEVKLISAYCNFIGAKLTNAFVIGKYTTRQSIDNRIDIHSLVELNNCGLSLEYKLV